MVILQKFSSAVLRQLRFLSAILGVVIGNVALDALSSQHPIWIWLPLVLLSIFLLVLPLLIKRELDRRPLEERQFTPKQIYAGMGLVHLAIILAGVYRLLTVRDAEWRLIIIVVVVLDICLLAFLTPRVLKVIKQSERGQNAVYDRRAYKNSAYLCFYNFVGVIHYSENFLFERSVRFMFYVKKSTCPYGHCFIPIAY